MNLKYITILSFLIILPIESSNAQIWKKIKNRTKEKVEDRVVDKISDKLAEVIIGKMSEKFDSPSNPFKGGIKISKPDNLPESYSFDWRYQLKIISNQNKDEEVKFDYFLSSESNYFGYTMEESPEMFSVVDVENEAIVSYMEDDGKSFAMSYSYPVSEVAENSYMEGAAEDVDITELPEKMILGYTAKGYQIDTPESQMIVYVTAEAGVSFSGMGGLPNQGVPKTFTGNLDEMENTLMLYMKFTDKSNSENVMEMECVSLKKESVSKNNKDYNFL